MVPKVIAPDAIPVTPHEKAVTYPAEKPRDIIEREKRL